MPGPYVGVQGVSTVSLSASGIETIVPARSNAPFKNLSFTIVPEAGVTPYSVSVYNAGQLVEQHTFGDTADNVICHLSYPDKIFPANVGTDAIPRFFDAGLSNPIGVSITVTITNLHSSKRTFVLYSLYEEYDAPRFIKL